MKTMQQTSAPTEARQVRARDLGDQVQQLEDPPGDYGQYNIILPWENGDLMVI